MALAPRDNPKIAVACMIPQGVTGGNANPVVREIIGGDANRVGAAKVKPPARKAAFPPPFDPVTSHTSPVRIVHETDAINMRFAFLMWQFSSVMSARCIASV